MIKEKKHITFFRFFFPAVFLLYFVGITLFSHTHVENGVVIVHSHPGKSGHNHTNKGLETIFFLSAIYTLGNSPLPCSFALWLAVISVMLVPALWLVPKAAMLGTLSLRAPPVLF